MTVTIVSGGQSGADRAALDVAVTLDLPYEGWCPPGGWAEDLPSPPGLLARYPLLRPTPDGPTSTRTRWNVRDSDAVLVLLVRGGAPSPGTLLTVEEAERLGRPVLVADVGEVTAVREWLAALPRPLRLDVAGPRESEQPGLYDGAYRLLSSVLPTV